MDSTEVYIGPEPHIEVHKYYGGVVPVVVSVQVHAFLRGRGGRRLNALP